MPKGRENSVTKVAKSLEKNEKKSKSRRKKKVYHPKKRKRLGRKKKTSTKNIIRKALTRRLITKNIN